jgi:hypothetical protein
LFGPELSGDDFPGMAPQLGDEQRRKLGRPPEIEADALSRAVTELQFILEQNWGVVGWLLKIAKSCSDVRNAFAKIVIQNSMYLEPFREYPTRKTSMQGLRSLRKRLARSLEMHRRNYARWQHAMEKCERAFRAWAVECDPVKRAQIQRLRPAFACAYEEAEALFQSSSMEQESLRTEVRECEAYIAQSEILRHLEANRRKFTPRNVALAMAGLPNISARVSCEKCVKYGINPSDGAAFETFRFIERAIPETILDLAHSIETMRGRLLKGALSDLSEAAQLRNNWYFLDRAIRSAMRVTVGQRGSVAFRIFAEYTRTSTSHSALDAILAGANRLLKADEEIELEQGLIWGADKKTSSGKAGHTR